MRRLVFGLTAFFGAGTALFALFYLIYRNVFLLSTAITFGTTFYHFAMRLLVGLFVNRFGKIHTFDCNSKWFAPKPFEDKLYKTLCVKAWKDRVPTFIPESFSLRIHSLDEIIQNMCVSEIVHEIIVVLSLAPILLAIPFGEFAVFLITSAVAALLDCLFVILQRYNRPRLVKLNEKHKKRASC
ncbi:MAG: hypothetical protein ACI4IW_07575 [Oscillospiraceae bacterium]